MPRIVTTLVLSLALCAPLPAVAQEPGEVAPGNDTSGASEAVRAQRKLAVLGEAGFNSLAGVGLNLLYRPIPRLALEAGAGFGGSGWKAGARARWNFRDSTWTPTLGFGFSATSGQGEGIVGDETTTNSFRVDPGYFVQAVAGLERAGPTGSSLLITAGWSFLLRENVYYPSGLPEPDTRRFIALLMHGGPTVAVAWGWAY